MTPCERQEPRTLIVTLRCERCGGNPSRTRQTRHRPQPVTNPTNTPLLAQKRRSQPEDSSPAVKQIADDNTRTACPRDDRREAGRVRLGRAGLEGRDPAAYDAAPSASRHPMGHPNPATHSPRPCRPAWNSAAAILLARLGGGRDGAEDEVDLEGCCGVRGGRRARGAWGRRLDGWGHRLRRRPRRRGDPPRRRVVLERNGEAKEVPQDAIRGSPEGRQAVGARRAVPNSDIFTLSTVLDSTYAYARIRQIRLEEMDELTAHVSVRGRDARTFH